MENLNNNSGVNSVSQQPSFNDVPKIPEIPNFDEDQKKSRWGTVLTLLVLIVLIFYFTGGSSWLSDKLGDDVAEDEINNEDIADLGEILGEDGIGDEDVKELVKSVESIEMGKGQMSLVVSASVAGGALQNDSEGEPTIEIKRVYIHNPFKDSWILVYDGIRPLYLPGLAVTKEKHELINTSLVAIKYDALRVQFNDLFMINGEKVKKDRVVDLGGVSVVEGKVNSVNLMFDLSGDVPRPVLVNSD